VHVPKFELQLFRNNQLVATHKIIVGARRYPTPSFATAISAVTLNPAWRPPAEITRREIRPFIKRNPTRAAALGYRFVDSIGAPHKPDDPSIASGSAFNDVQLPGPANALGRVKLEMANPFAVYVHDTPAQALFNRDVRAFSHSCIRVENARELAALLVDPQLWPLPALDAGIADGPTRTLPLAKPMPIHLLYLTAQPGSAGAVQYSADLDGRDQRLVRAMDAPDTAKNRAALADGPTTECRAPSSQ
jgi:murein L,D-transpeptidase YcbB/YkuD